MQLRLKQLRLANFKRHGSLIIDFSDTLTVIRGGNYKGKSSTLQAIFFALGGTTAVPGGKKVLIKRGEKTCRVELDLTDGEKVYSVTRTPTTAGVYLGDDLLASGHTAVNEWVEQQLKLDFRRMMMLAFSPQSETAAMLTLGAAALNRLIEEVSGVDYVEKLIVAASARVKRSESKLETMPPIADTTQLHLSVYNCDEAYTTVSKQLDDTVTKIGGVTKRKKQLVVEITEIDEHNGRLALAQRQRDQKKGEAAALEKQHAQLDVERENLALNAPDVTALLADANLRQREVEQLTEKSAEQAEIERQITTLTKWFETTGAQWEESSKRIPEAERLSAELAKQKEVVGETTRAYLVMQAEVNTLKKEIAGAVCSACKRPFDDKHLAAAEKKLEKAEKILNTNQTNKDKEDSLFEEIQSKYNAAKTNLPPAGWEETYNGKVAEQEALAARYEAIPDDLSASLATARTRARAATQAHAAGVATAQRLAALTLQLAALREQHEALAASVAALPVGEPRDASRQRTELATVDEALATLNAAKAELTGQQASWASQLKRERELLATAESSNQKRTAEELVLSRFSGLLKWLRDSKAQFLTEVWDGLLALTSEFLTAATMGNVTELRRNDEGDFTLVEGDEEGAIEGASGGQKAIASVGLRLALSSLLPQGLGFVVLDEASAELNDEHAAALAGALRMQDRQVVVVTHREGEEFASDQVYVLE